MSSWLVDTHALLWFVEDDERLSDAAQTTMEDRDAVLYVSAASIWEIAIKTALGKLRGTDQILEIFTDGGFEELPVSAADAWAVRDLPDGPHRDPFDRLLVTQALRRGLPIISADPVLDAYGVARHW